MSRRESVEVINTSPVPQELTGGRMLGPGEKAEVKLDKHLRERIEVGALTVTGGRDVPAEEAEGDADGGGAQ